MNENKRTVTILIPCYNEEESLPMLFVDDGSKDSTRDEIREFASNRHPT